MPRKTPRIQDVALIAGVSTATVSRSLSNPGMVAEATHRAVMEAVKITGYRINATARNLRRQRSGNVVALVPNLANPFFSQILAGMSSVLSPAGFGLLIADTKTEHRPVERLSYFLASGLADGVVVFDGTLADDELANRVGVPVVMACEWSETDLPSVRVANAEGAATAIGHLARMGHRRIGHLSGPADNVLTLSRQEGMRVALQRLGLPLHAHWQFGGDFSMESGARAAQLWLAQHDRPTAVFCASDEMAIGFIAALQGQGIAVPRDVSVMGFDDIEVSSHMTPALTTIHQPRGDIGIAAARLLTALIETSNATPTTLTLPVTLIRRNSVAAPPSKSSAPPA